MDTMSAMINQLLLDRLIKSRIVRVRILGNGHQLDQAEDLLESVDISDKKENHAINTTVLSCLPLNAPQTARVFLKNYTLTHLHSPHCQLSRRDSDESMAFLPAVSAPCAQS